MRPRPEFLPRGQMKQCLMFHLHQKLVFYESDVLQPEILFLYCYYGRPMEQGRPLYFCPVISFFFFFFFSLPNLSGPRLDVYHTSTHGVALEFRIHVWNVLHLACWKYRMQIIAKNSPPGHHCTTSLGCRFATKAHIDNQKKIIQQQYLLHVSSQYGELRTSAR